MRRFPAIARELAGQPFVWGWSDCTAVVLRALSELTGVDHLRAARRGDTWSSPRSALTFIARHGGFARYLRATLPRASWDARPELSVAVMPGRALAPSYLLWRAAALTSAPRCGVIVIPAMRVPTCCELYEVPTCRRQ